MISYILWVILATILVIGVWIILDMLWQTANAQQENVTTAMPNLQISPPSNIQTTPNPNLQYLPQKAFIQAFSPEATPTTQSAILGPLPNTVVQPTGTVQTTGSLGGNDIVTIINTILAAGSGFVAKIGLDKAKKAQETTKENSSAIVDSKIVQQELARLMFEWNKDKADTLTDSPVTKLESLKDEVKQATETATKA